MCSSPRGDLPLPRCAGTTGRPSQARKIVYGACGTNVTPEGETRKVKAPSPPLPRERKKENEIYLQDGTTRPRAHLPIRPPAGSLSPPDGWERTTIPAPHVTQSNAPPSRSIRDAPLSACLNAQRVSLSLRSVRFHFCTFRASARAAASAESREGIQLGVTVEMNTRRG